jgi:hypothetical protein
MGRSIDVSGHIPALLKCQLELPLLREKAKQTLTIHQTRDETEPYHKKASRGGRTDEHRHITAKKNAYNISYKKVNIV